MANPLRRILYRIVQNNRKKCLSECGDDVAINKNTKFIGNVHIGSHVRIGENNLFVSSQAHLYIHDYVLTGPNVTIYTGDHKIDAVGKHIFEISDADKKAEAGKWDKDVVIKAGAWIGTETIILKGVTVGQGAVIGAGAIVAKDVPPYHIYVGTPQNFLLKPRFTEEQISEHEQILKKRGVTIE